MNDIRYITIAELEDFLVQNGEKKFRKQQILDWIWQKGVHHFSEMRNLPLSLQKKLAETFTFQHATIATSVQSADESVKFLFQFADNQQVEGVLMPTEKRVTACLSTQIGCPLRCAFCATGSLGFTRNLHFSEIFDQFLLMNAHALHHFDMPITNIVLMGMGEPLLNVDNVLKFIELMTSSALGQGWSPSRITMSTAGIVDGIRQLADLQFKAGLAISLHSADPETRLKLMPITAANPLPRLQKALHYFHSKTGARITMEYLLISGVNDSPADAEKLWQFCKPFPVKINLIPYNETSHSDFRASMPEQMKKFLKYLEIKNLVVTIRHSRGQDIAAACGQLAKKEVIEKEKERGREGERK